LFGLGFTFVSRIFVVRHGSRSLMDGGIVRFVVSFALFYARSHLLFLTF